MEISHRGDPPATRRGLINLARSIKIAERLFSPGRAREISPKRVREFKTER
jgi:hypothetical protein